MLMILNRKLPKKRHRLNHYLAKIIIIWGLLLYLLLLGGCSNQKQTSTSEVTEISFWHGINPPENRDIFQGLVDSFNLKNPDIKVKAIYIGQPDAQLPKILAATVSNQPPDILWFVAQIAGKLNAITLFCAGTDIDNSHPYS